LYSFTTITCIILKRYEIQGNNVTGPTCIMASMRVRGVHASQFMNSIHDNVHSHKHNHSFLLY
jgi:hypothetical protein